MSKTEEKWEYLKKNEDWYHLDWLHLCKKLDIEDRDAILRVYKELFFLYEDPSRHYHNLFHVYKIVSESFHSAYSLLEGQLATHMAIWFHDAIYDTKASDNEEKSAALAQDKIRELGLSDDFGNKVADLIIATKHQVKPEDLDAQYLVDMDLSIFGQTETVFDNYEMNIRREYDWVPDADFVKGRKRILEHFLNRPQIYWTDFFRKKHEAAARKNLERSIKRL